MGTVRKEGEDSLERLLREALGSENGGEGGSSGGSLDVEGGRLAATAREALPGWQQGGRIEQVEEDRTVSSVVIEAGKQGNRPGVEAAVGEYVERNLDISDTARKHLGMTVEEDEHSRLRIGSNFTTITSFLEYPETR